MSTKEYMRAYYQANRDHLRTVSAARTRVWRAQRREDGGCHYTTSCQEPAIQGGGGTCATHYWSRRASQLRCGVAGVGDTACANGEALRLWYEAQVQYQAGRCMCGVELREHDAIDHCHDTGLLRGILCFRCNKAVDEYDRIKGWALTYLNFHGGLAPENRSAA